MQCLPVKVQVSNWGAESNGRCLMTLEAVQDIKRGIRMSEVRTVRCHPVKNRPSLHCSQIAPFQKIVKLCFC